MQDNRVHLKPADEAPPGRDKTMAAPRRLRSSDLLAGAREIVIDHDGRLYQLRITQNGKLILTA